MELPPGSLQLHDFRPGGPSKALPERPIIKLLTWNIERGCQLPGIIEELRRNDADVISLQEVDIGNDRSNGVDTGAAIAEALGLNYVFLCEFEEIHSPLRDARSQGGGVHGNAILTRFDVLETAVVPHRSHPVDWNNPQHALARREPRRGERAILRAVLDTPQGKLVVYCAHLEVFCGLLARIEQLTDIFADARTMADRGFQHQAILGDMNTMAHGIARVSPNYCCDWMRFRSIGMDEATVWDKYVLPVVDWRYASQAAAGDRSEAAMGGARGGSAAAGAVGAHEAAPPSADAVAAGAGGAQQGEAPVNTKLMAWGLSRQVAEDATNPGFIDPFPPSTATLDNPAYRFFGISLMKGKLDWLLLRRLRAVPGRERIGNDDYALSDHRWLAAEVEFE